MLAGLAGVAHQLALAARIRPRPPGHLEVGVERHLGVGDEAAALRQQEAGVGAQPPSSPSWSVSCSSKSTCSVMPAISTQRRSCSSPHWPRVCGWRSAFIRAAVWRARSPSRLHLLEQGARSAGLPRRGSGRTSASILSWFLPIGSASAWISAWRLSSVASAACASTLRDSSLTRSRSATAFEVASWIAGPWSTGAAAACGPRGDRRRRAPRRARARRWRGRWSSHRW